MKMRKRFLGILLSLVMVLGLMPSMSLTALASPLGVDGPGIPIGPIVIKTAGSISYTATSVSKTYGDAVFTNELAKTGDGTVSYESNNTNVATVNSATGAVTIAGAGEAIVTATVTDSNNYTYGTKTASYTVTVNKANPTNTVEQLSAFVGQTLAEVALPTAENGVWNWEDDTTTTLNELGMTTHFAKFTPNDTNNYNPLDNVSVQIEVAEKPMAVPATVTANNRTYDGTEKPLVTAGEASGGEMQYALGTKDAATEPYTTSIPAKTDAGTYYVWYMVKGDDGHADTEASCVPVTIQAGQTEEPAKEEPATEEPVAGEPTKQDDKRTPVYFDATDYTAASSGWRHDGSGIWYQNADGSYEHNGWKQINGKWFYFQSSGYALQNQWQGDYYLTSDGSMATDTWIGSYYVDASGKWVPNLLPGTAEVQNGQWLMDGKKWWFRYEDGSYPAQAWVWIDDDQDGIAECYYFDAKGYMVSNKTVDGSKLNKSGQWIVNKNVQKKKAVIRGAGKSVD